MIENGERVLKHLEGPEDEIIIAEGKHDGIVDVKVFEAAQARFSKNPRIKQGVDLINLYSGVLKCKKCGRVMMYDPRPEATARYICRSRPCCYKSGKAPEVDVAILVALKEGELPKLQKLVASGAGNAAEVQKDKLKKLNKKIAELRAREDKQYDFLESGRYTQEVFDRRNIPLRAEIEKCEKDIFRLRESMPKSIDYKDALVKLERAIEVLEHPGNLTVNERNRILRDIIDRIEYTSINRGLNKTDIRLRCYLKI